MMKLNTMPKEFACELLTYVAEKTDFSDVSKALDGSVTDIQVRALLREIANNLQTELKEEKAENYDVRNCTFLTKDTKKVISFLSPKEEKTLLKVFGLLEENKK